MTKSALLGQPPQTPLDYVVAEYILVHILGKDSDPKNGTPGFPLAKPPPGYQGGDNDLATAFRNNVIAVLIFTMVSSILRIGARIFMKKMKWGWDDTMMVCATISALVYMITWILETTIGAQGKHIYDLTYDNFNNDWILGRMFSITMWCALGFTKISVALFMIRLVKRSNWWPTTLNILLGTVISWTAVAVLLSIFQCGNPVPMTSIPKYMHYIKTHHKVPKCLSDAKIEIGISASHLGLDLIIFGLAVAMFGRLQTSWFNRIKLISFFSTGLFVCGCVASRIIYDVKHLQLSPDYSYENIKVIRGVPWTIMDIGISVIIANSPVIYAMFKFSYEASLVKGSGSSTSTALKPTHRSNEISTGFRPSTSKESDVADEEKSTPQRRGEEWV